MKVRTTPRSRWILVAGALGIAALVPTVSAFADVTIQTVCGETMDSDVGGGAAHWEASCDGNSITVSGWVKDTSADGKCARVKAYIDGRWRYSKKACPTGEVQNFSLTGSDRSANVYLYVK